MNRCRRGLTQPKTQPLPEKRTTSSSPSRILIFKMAPFRAVLCCFLVSAYGLAFLSLLGVPVEVFQVFRCLFLQLRVFDGRLVQKKLQKCSTREWVGTGGSEPPASRTLFSRLPYLYLPTPALIGIDFALSKTKNWVVKETTPHSPAGSFERGGGGYSTKFWVGVCRWDSETLRHLAYTRPF